MQGTAVLAGCVGAAVSSMLIVTTSDLTVCVCVSLPLSRLLSSAVKSRGRPDWIYIQMPDPLSDPAVQADRPQYHCVICHSSPVGPGPFPSPPVSHQTGGRGPSSLSLLTKLGQHRLNCCINSYFLSPAPTVPPRPSPPVSLTVLKMDIDLRYSRLQALVSCLLLKIGQRE